MGADGISIQNFPFNVDDTDVRSLARLLWEDVTLALELHIEELRPFLLATWNIKLSLTVLFLLHCLWHSETLARRLLLRQFLGGHQDLDSALEYDIELVSVVPLPEDYGALFMVLVAEL